MAHNGHIEFKDGKIILTCPPLAQMLAEAEESNPTKEEIRKAASEGREAEGKSYILSNAYASTIFNGVEVKATWLVRVDKVAARRKRRVNLLEATKPVGRK